MKFVIRLVLPAALAMAALMAPSSALALTSNADAGTWQVNGKVFALARSGNTLFIGGKFTKLISPDGLSHQAAKNIAAIDMTTGAPVAGFNTRVTLAVSGVTVRALGVSGDGTTLYIGGNFDAINDTPFGNFGAVSTTTGEVAAGFVPPSFSGKVHAILVGPSRIYVGGSFHKVGAVTRNFAAAVTSTGALDAWAPNPNDTVRSFAMSADNATVFIGGHFTQVGTPAVNRQSVARVDATTGAVNSWAIPAGTIDNPQTAWSILPYGNRVFIGFGKGPNYVASFRLDNGFFGSQVWRFNTVGNDESLAMNADGSRLFVGGHFGTARLQQNVCGNVALHGLMSMNPATGGVNCDWLPTITPWGDNFTGAWAMISTGTQLWVGGFIDAINGQAHSGFARWTL